MSPPPLHPKLGLTNLIVNNPFTRNPNLEEQFADQLGNEEERSITCNAFLKEVVPSSVHQLVECLEALHRVVIGVFGQILVPGFENDTSTFEEKLTGAMRTHNPRMTPKVHALVHHVPEYVSRTGV